MAWRTFSTWSYLKVTRSVARTRGSDEETMAAAAAAEGRMRAVLGSIHAAAAGGDKGEAVQGLAECQSALAGPTE